MSSYDDKTHTARLRARTSTLLYMQGPSRASLSLFTFFGNMTVDQEGCVKALVPNHARIVPNRNGPYKGAPRHGGCVLRLLVRCLYSFKVAVPSVNAI